MNSGAFEKLENYLIKMDAKYEAVGEGMWIVEDGGIKIAIKAEDSIVFFRINLFNLPGKNLEKLFRKLLELNTTSMMLGAYGIEKEKVVIVDSLTTENIDFNEFQSSIESISLAAVDHFKELKALIS
jgi:hypothetical protein